MTDPEIFRCKRKTPYPLLSSAQAAAARNSRETGENITAYQCEFCGKFHIGHQPVTKDLRNESHYKFLMEYEGVLLAKLRDTVNFYIFAVPEGTGEYEADVLNKGILIAIKKGGDFYYEAKGLKSTHYRAFNLILPIYIKEAVHFLKLIEQHENYISTFHEVQMDVLNKCFVGTMERLKQEEARHKAIFNPPTKREEEKKLLESTEMYQDRAVFREEGHKPYHREFVKCCMEGCKAEIEIRTPISTDAEGKLTWLNPKIPANSRVTKSPLSIRSKSKWICAECSHKLATGAPLPKEEQKKEEEQKKKEMSRSRFDIDFVDATILADLQTVALDPAIDAGFVRGAAIMACYLLGEGK